MLQLIGGILSILLIMNMPTLSKKQLPDLKKPLFRTKATPIHIPSYLDSSDDDSLRSGSLPRDPGIINFKSSVARMEDVLKHTKMMYKRHYKL